MTALRLSPAPLEPVDGVGSVSFEVISSPACAAGRVVRLACDRLLVGRDAGATLSFDDARLSRRHAEVRREGDGFVLVDLASTHGSWVNGARCHRRALQHGDSVRLGATVLLFVDGRVTGAEASRLEVEAAASCIDDNLRSLQQALVERCLSVEQLDEITRECGRAAARLSTHARGEEAPHENETPVVRRVLARSA